jgi:hypothetical protein
MAAQSLSVAVAHAGRFAVARDTQSKGHFIKQNIASNDVLEIEVDSGYLKEYCHTCYGQPSES